MMLLSEIIGNAGILGITGNADVNINGLQFDSRKVRPGNVFFAI